MSDTEDQNILEEIQALENALTKPKNVDLDYNVPSTSTKDDMHMIVYENSISDYEESIEEEEVDTKPNSNEQLEKLLELNQQLADSLREAKDKFLSLIEQCKARQDLVSQKLKSRMKYSSTKSYNWTISMPYFKSKDGYFAPLNEDAKLKAERAELEIHHLSLISRWTMKDKHILLEAIRDEIKAEIRNERILDQKKVFSAEVKEHIGALGEREFDWMKIGTREFQNRHTAEECRVMWNVFLHPCINKTKWTKKENALLNVLVRNHNFQDWDKIAQLLGSNRSGYQCFIRYNTTNMKHNMKSNIWTKEEDDKLKRIIELLKVGNFIPWGEVSSYLPERTKQQIYYRWTYNVAPYLKKGRFTQEEDVVFRMALEKYGPNFCRISAFVMPQRTSAQLNDHYNTLHSRETAEKLGRQGRSWDFKEDMKLLKLYGEYGTNWSRIAKEFENRTRIQLRHRYAAIKRYESRGIDVESIPRVSNDDIEEDVKELAHVPTHIDDIDKELIRYFREVHQTSNQTVSSGTKKFFSTQELTDNVPKLYNILQTLHMNIGDPDCLNQDGLSEKDRQLFHVLSEFCKRSANSVERQQIVQHYRMRMFGPNEPTGERYVPQLTFCIAPRQSRVFKKSHNASGTIDYVQPTYINTQLQIQYNFETTPAHILSEIGDIEGDDIFEKLKVMMILHENKRFIAKPKHQDRKIYILSPEVLNKYILQSNESPGLLVINKPNVDCQQSVENSVEEFTNELNYCWDWKAGVKGIDDDTNFLYPVIQPNRNRREGLDDQITFIKPNCALLQCYQVILNYLKMMSMDETFFELQKSCKVSLRGRAALKLLLRRFEMLFMYPIQMARVSIQSGNEPGEEKANYYMPFEDRDEEEERRQTQKRMQRKRKRASKQEYILGDHGDDEIRNRQMQEEEEEMEEELEDEEEVNEEDEKKGIPEMKMANLMF